jgi:NAD(P)-dependent dehydrogenase (short-subunit alcohol dehydrogenase family)
MDLTHKTQIKAAFDAGVKAFGKFDVLKNAGAFQSGEAEAIPDQEARKIFDVTF